MNKVLGVVQYNRRKIRLFLDFVLAQRIPEMIETIRLRSRSVLSSYDNPDLLRTGRCCRNRGYGFGIIWIAAHINAILA